MQKSGNNRKLQANIPDNPQKPPNLIVKGIDENTLRRLYIDENLTAQKIADRYGLHLYDIHSIIAIVRRNGFADIPHKTTFKPIQYPFPDLDEFQDLYASGYSHTELANHFGVPKTAVISWINRLRRVTPELYPKRPQHVHCKSCVPKTAND